MKVIQEILASAVSVGWHSPTTTIPALSMRSSKYLANG